MAGYTHINFGEAKTQLSLRLDASKTFWTDSELGLYLIEAIRVWSLAAQFYRDFGLVPTVSGTAFYDLGTMIDGSGVTLLPHTITDQDLILEIENHLLEPQSSTSWIGTDQFIYEDVVRAIERRTNQFLLETGCTITRTVVPLGSPPVESINIPDTTIDVRRITYRNASGTYKQLWQDEAWSTDFFNRSPGPTPITYSVILSPPCTLALGPPATDAGTIEMLSIQSVGTLDPANGPTTLPVPNDMVWAIKWGVLADLLSKDGPANDQPRAAYCQQRWDEGVGMAKIASSVIFGSINGIANPVTSVFDADAYSASWQNTQSTPTLVLMAGLNLMALSPTPNGIFSIGLDVVRAAPVPTADADPIQLGREQLDAILDYAQHIAQFKQGAYELEQTKGLYNNLLNLASLQNDRLRAKSGENFETFRNRSRRETIQRPMAIAMPVSPFQ